MPDAPKKEHWKVRQKRLREEAAKSESVSGAPTVDVPVTPVQDPDGEMAFIDACLSRAVAEKADKCKYMYDRVVLAVQTRRVLRDVMGSMEAGEKFPQWAELGRNDATGEEVADFRSRTIDLAAERAKQAAAAAAPAVQIDPLQAILALLQKQQAAPAAAAAMASREATAVRPSDAQILSQVTGGPPSLAGAPGLESFSGNVVH